MENKYYAQYKGWWYKFVPGLEPIESGGVTWLYPGIWRFADRQDEMGWLFTYNAEIYRLDQCFEDIFKETEKHGKQ